MQHHPHALVLIQAQLDEVIAAAERAQLGTPQVCAKLTLHLHHARVLAHDLLESIIETRPWRACAAATNLVGLVLVEAHRARVHSTALRSFARFPEDPCAQREANGIHAAADIHADALAGMMACLVGIDTAHGRADAMMQTSGMAATWP